MRSSASPAVPQCDTISRGKSAEKWSFLFEQRGDEAKVWTTESPDLPGLVTEAESLDALDAKLPALIHDLIDGDEPEGPEYVLASFSKRVSRSSRTAEQSHPQTEADT